MTIIVIITSNKVGKNRTICSLNAINTLLAFDYDLKMMMAFKVEEYK